jgi:hypothetical protein
MSIFMIFCSILISVSALYVKPGEVEITDESFEELQKIAGGLPSKKGEMLSFCYISVNFFQKQQTCGCLIYNSQYVVTTARCVVE